MTTDDVLQRLLQWFSPAYPTGAFSFSHGLEWAVEGGLVMTREQLVAWLEDLLRHGGGWSDAVLFAHAYAAAGDVERLAALGDLARALPASSELLLETTVQGDAFVRTTSAVWPEAPLDGVDDLPMPVAAGCAAARHDLPLGPVLVAYLHAFAANLVSAGVRLIPLGQTDGQRALAVLVPIIGEVADRAPQVGLDELGTATVTVDWCSMRHETQHTRLFRS
jgi:urease accessory protein